MSMFSVISVSSGLIINNPWVWYSLNILHINKDKSKHKSTRGPVDWFWCHDGRCSLDSQHMGTDQHPVNVGYSSSRYTNDGQIDHSHQSVENGLEKIIK